MLELARMTDRAQAERLARQVHELHVAWRPDLYEMPEELFPEALFQSLIQNRELYVAKISGMVVGYALLRIRVSEGPGKIRRKIMLIDQLAVDEEFQNHGIGTQMLQEVHALARAFGCTDLQLNVYPQNDAAVSFYQKCGFTIRTIEMQRKV